MELEHSFKDYSCEKRFDWRKFSRVSREGNLERDVREHEITKAMVEIFLHELVDRWKYRNLDTIGIVAQILVSFVIFTLRGTLVIAIISTYSVYS